MCRIGHSSRSSDGSPSDGRHSHRCRSRPRTWNARRGICRLRGWVGIRRGAPNVAKLVAEVRNAADPDGVVHAAAMRNEPEVSPGPVLDWSWDAEDQCVRIHFLGERSSDGHPLARRHLPFPACHARVGDPDLRSEGGCRRRKWRWKTDRPTNGERANPAAPAPRRGSRPAQGRGWPSGHDDPHSAEEPGLLARTETTRLLFSTASATLFQPAHLRHPDIY